MKNKIKRIEEIFFSGKGGNLKEIRSCFVWRVRIWHDKVERSGKVRFYLKER